MRSVIVVMLLHTIAHADTAVAPCRPTVTCTAELAAPGTLELELGDQLRRSDGANTETTPFLVKLPLAHWLEVQVGDNGYTAAPGTRYFDNPVVGAKLHLIDQAGERPSIALTISAGLPTQNPAELIATAHASHDYGAYHVDANVGLAAWRNVTQPFAAVALSHPISARWAATLEPHYFAYAQPLAPRDGGAIAAIAFALRPWLVIDAAIDGVAIGPRALAGLAGVSIAPVRIWGGH